MERYCQKKIFFKILDRIFEKLSFHKTAWSFIINSRIVIRISNERTLHPIQENEAVFPKNIYIFQFSAEFSKNYSCLLLLCYWR